MSAKPAMTRRNFLAFGGAAALAGTGLSALRAPVAAPAPALAAITPPPAAPAAACPAGLTLAENACLRSVTLADFAPLLGQDFTVANPENTATLRLEQAHPHRRPADSLPSAARHEPFSLLFVANDGSQLPDAIHDVQHPATGPLKLFLGKVGGQHASGRTYYEIVFG